MQDKTLIVEHSIVEIIFSTSSLFLVGLVASYNHYDDVMTIHVELFLMRIELVEDVKISILKENYLQIIEVHIHEED